MPFAPDVAINLSTPVPRAPAAITAVVTNPGDSTAISSIGVTFPKAFTFNETFRPKRCQPKDEKAMTCPADSRIGGIEATAFGMKATGNVFLTQDFRLAIVAKALGGALTISAQGKITVAPTGGFAVTFTGLPNLPVTNLTLSLSGDRLALLKTPKRPRTYTLPTHFESFEGESADRAAPVTINPARRRQATRP